MNEVLAWWNPQTQTWDSPVWDLLTGEPETFAGVWPASGIAKDGRVFAAPESGEGGADR